MIRTSTKTAASEIFVDTSGWYTLNVAGERYHSVSKEYFQRAVASRHGITTSDYVLDETLTRLRYDYGYKAAMNFYAFILEAQALGYLRIIRIDEECWQDALDIFTRYDDVAFSFTDCTSFALCQRQDIAEVFTFDAHFGMFGLDVRPIL